MKFKCPQTVIFKAVNIVSRAVASKSTVAILKGILLEIKNSKAYLTASDLNMSISTAFDVQDAEDGSTVVSAKLFSDIIRKLPNFIVNFNLSEDKDKLLINCLGSDYSIVALPSDEFPTVSDLKSTEYFDFKTADLENLIKKTVFCAATDEKKGILTGCLIRIDQFGIEAAAIDGFRMGVCRKSCDMKGDKTVVIPADILSEVEKILSESENDTVRLFLEDKRAEFAFNDTRITSRLLEGDFIAYNSIIPSSWQSRITVNREDLLISLERASLFTKEGKNNLIRMYISDAGIKIDCKSEDGNAVEFVAAELNGNDITIGFNSKYIIDILKCISSEDEIIFSMNTPNSACTITPVDGDDFVYLILPVRLAQF